MRTLLFIISIIFFTTSCKKDVNIYDYYETYIHLSHTRLDTNPFVDSNLYHINFEKYDMKWLGGDLAYSTSKDDKTIMHIDSIFDLGNINTLWSLGNHDNYDINRVKNITNRPAYYTYNRNGLTIVVLNTQDSSCNIVGKQREFLNEILDTIQYSSHLIILHHKLIWMNDGDYLQTKIASVSNGPFGECNYCINPNNFYSYLYPELVKVRRKGIKVICVGGDIGINENEFEYLTADDIYFLASGISQYNKHNKGLLFYHDVGNRSLVWEYVYLEDL